MNEQLGGCVGGSGETLAGREGRAAAAMPSCLIVGDSRLIRTIARRILVGLGYALGEAAGAAEALTACTRAMPDLIVVDHRLPALDGIALVRTLRALPGGATARIVVSSAEDDPAHIAAALAAGADEYVMHPFDGEILRGKLAQMGLAQ